MKKIMFNDQYGLTQAVLDGIKTQSRRNITLPRLFKGKYVAGFHAYRNVGDNNIYDICLYDEDERDFEGGQINPKYKIGEIVAVAQNYTACGGFMDDGTPRWDYISCIVGSKNRGWSNKMFVKPELMPHQIKITNVRIERLQDISDDDCMSEGIVVNEPKIKGGVKSYYPCEYLKSCADKVGWGRVFDTPRKAYAELIDKVSGKGTWDRNPYVFVYDFELIK